ncbi:MAG: hypothetical protein H6859_00420 [Rhodospirillales bacterium]|nr:hypothetical protein [Alphaproteobacteria bacterium]USO05706.1 MAG: hypothetical protein H6859_00420 [Rhodospirillales bacterium]
MPQAVALVPVVLGGLTSHFVGAAVGGGVIGAIVGGLAGAAVVSFTAPIFAPKPDVPKFDASVSVTNVPASAKGRTEMIRQPITTQRIVYGEIRASGPLVFAHSRPIDGNSDKLDILHLVIVVAAHEVEAIGDMIFNDEVVTLDGNGEATLEPYKEDGTVYATVYKHLGESDQEADSVLVSNSGGKWTNAHRLRGLAYLHVMLRYNEKAYASGIPNISALVKGRKVYDPRSETEAWSDNAALCILDYLLADFGLGASINEIDVNSFIAAANTCDEEVATLTGTEKRYTCNGVVDLGDSPRAILEGMLSSCAGFLVHTGGKWRLHVGAYAPPVKTLDDSFLRDGVVMRPHRSRRKLFNTLRGAYASPDHNWQPIDYPAVSSDLYIAEDNGEEITSTLDLSFTTSHTMAQRIARIALEQIRRQRQIEYPANLAGFQVSAGNTIALNLPRLGLADMPCRVTNWQMVEDMGINLTLDEDGPDVYYFDPGDLQDIGDNPQIVTPNNQAQPPTTPRNLTASAGDNFITVSWDAITDSDLRYVEVWERTADTENPEVDAARILEVYGNSFTRNLLAGSETRFYWVRSVDRYGNKSEFAGPVEATTSGDQTVVLVLE